MKTIFMFLMFVTFIYPQDNLKTEYIGFVNATDSSITVTNLTIVDSSIVSVIDTLTYPFTITSGNTIYIPFIIDKRKTPDVYSKTMTITTNYAVKNKTFNITISEP